MIIGGDGKEITEAKRKKRTLPLGRPGPLEGMGFIDTWRELRGSSEGYTFWSYRFEGRRKNNGWRLDYFIMSQELKSGIIDCVRRNEMWGPSDHIPLVLSIKEDVLH